MNMKKRMGSWWMVMLGVLALLSRPAAADGGVAGDQVFLRAALATNRFELALGRLAVAHAVTPAVQAQGKKMLEKHTELGGKLDALAATAGVSSPSELSAAEQATVARLAALAAGSFDGQFVATVDDVHQKELAIYRAETAAPPNGASSPSLRALVEQRVTALQKSVTEASLRAQKQDW
jgi:predicted outer membrane protein